MPEEDIFLKFEAELAVLRSLVILLVERLAMIDPSLKPELLDGLSKASNVFFRDELLDEQGSRAVMLSIAYEDLRDRIGRLR